MRELADTVRTALHNLIRKPLHAATAVAVLAVGLGAVTLVAAAYDAVVLRPLPFRDPERLVTVLETHRGRPWVLSPPNFVDFRREGTSFESLAAYNESSYALSGTEGAAEQVSGASVTADWFRVLGVEAAIGRTLGAADDVPAADTVVVSHELWRRRFGADPALVGKRVELDGTPRTVVGVMPAGFSWPLGSEIWLPLVFSAEDLTGQRGAHYLMALGRLRPGVTVEQAGEQLRAVAARLAKAYPDTNEESSALVRAHAAHVVRRARPTLLVLAGAVLLSLVAACANLASLALARAIERGRELAVRLSLGARPARLVREMLVESLLLALAGGALGGLIAAALIDALPRFTGEMPRLGEARLGLGVVVAAGTLAGLCGLATGLLPALQALRRDPSEALRAGGRTLAGHAAAGRARRALVVATTALAFVLLAGAALVVRSWRSVTSIDPGLARSGRLSFQVGLPAGRYDTAEKQAAFVADLVERLGALPGVDRAAASFGQPYTEFLYTITITARDGSPLPDGDDTPSAEVRVVTPGYFEAAGIPLLSGRDFTPADRHGSAPVVVASARAARDLFGGKEALGRTVELGTVFVDERGRLGGEVIGVVGDVRDQRLEEEPRPILYFVYDQAPASNVTLTLAAPPARLAALVEPARRTLAAIDPDVPMYSVRTIEQLLAAALAPRRVVTQLLSGFAAATALLAAIGLFGVLAASVAERRAELAVRGALGATPLQLVGIVLSQAALLGGLGIGIGLLAAVPLARLLQGQLYQISPSDPRTLALAGIALVLVTLASSWAPARRAARTDPMAVLREQ